MELQLVTFEQAKSLKELGFPQESEAYNMHTYIYLDNAINLQDNHKCDKELMQVKDFYNGAFDDWDMYIAPTLELVAKWLREEKDLWIHMCKPYQDSTKWSSSVNGISRHLWKPCSEYDSYEQALNAGINKSIEILKLNK